MIGLAQARHARDTRVFHPFALLIQSLNGNTALPLINAPRLQRVLVTQFFFVSTGAGAVGAWLELTGPGCGPSGTIVAYASLAANSQVGAPDIEIPAGATLSLVTAGGISGGSLQVCCRSCILENTETADWNGDRV